MNIDLHHQINTAVALDNQAITTDTTTVGNIIDTLNYNGLEFVIQSATLTDGAYTPKIEDGDDSGLSDAADVSTTYLLGTIAEATFALTDDDTSKRIGYVGKKRYVRLSLVSASTSTGGTLGAVAIKHLATRVPTAADA